MTREEIDFVIDTLETAIEWAEYADEYFKKKHGLEQDQKNVFKSIELLKAIQYPKTCETCVTHNYTNSECDLLRYMPSFYRKDFGCIHHKAKE